MMLEESLRRAEFAFIDFRDSPIGRQAYVMGTRLAVWQVVAIVRALGGDPQKAADHLEWPLLKVQAALQYAEAFPEEASLEADTNELQALKRSLPQLELFTIRAR